MTQIPHPPCLRAFCFSPIFTSPGLAALPAELCVGRSCSLGLQLPDLCLTLADTMPRLSDISVVPTSPVSTFCRTYSPVCLLEPQGPSVLSVCPHPGIKTHPPPTCSFLPVRLRHSLREQWTTCGSAHIQSLCPGQTQLPGHGTVSHSAKLHAQPTLAGSSYQVMSWSRT